MNWKLIVVVFTSLILFIVCYLILVSSLSEVKNYFINKKIQEPILDFKINRKIKINFSKEDEFISFINDDFKKVNQLSNEYIAYYFPEGCPSYKSGYFLIDKNEEGQENYYVPEDGYLVIVNKDHQWTKEPSFEYWTNINKNNLDDKLLTKS
jgi:hypothetical protein